MNRPALCSLFFSGLLISAAGQDPRSEYEAEAPKTIFQLQQFRETSSIQIRAKSGDQGTAALINLNPAINSWYVLVLRWGSGPALSYHLENAHPGGRKLLLDAKCPFGLVIEEGGHRSSCELFASAAANALDRGRSSPRAYYPLCDGRIYLRNPASGHNTTLEAATEFLREHLWGSEKIIAIGHVLMGDVNRETGSLETEGRSIPTAPGGNPPASASVDPKFSDRLLTSANLGIVLEQPVKSGMRPGAWYAANGNPGVFVSIVQPNLIAAEILESYQTRVNRLDSVEASALCYLVAFDLDRFEIGYELGTEHPKVGWSDHMLAQQRDSKLPGPDGIGTFSPLVATGMVSPEYAPKTVATFIGGFKRMHGAFKYGDLALKNHGSHYGFIEQGVVFSKLQPELSTVYILNNGWLGMKTWTESDNQLLPQIRHARQNGVPVVESGIPGTLVNRWGAGNWSGSEDMKLRTMRAALALQRSGRKRFLIYAVFSDATPSAMARVFQAYHCDDAMLLDMNALEHTYLALYRRAGSQLFVDHLVKGMDVLEKSASGEVVPRFLGYADNRDFFYVMRREK